MGISTILQNSTALQKVLCIVSTASIFLPWIQINLLFTTMSVDLLTLTLGGGIRSHILMCLGGALFMVGSVALLKWKRAPLLQVAGLMVFPMGLLTAIAPSGAETAYYSEAFQALRMVTGPGVYVGWGAALLGVVLMLKGWPTPRFLQDASRFRPHRHRAGEDPAPIVQPRPAAAGMSFSAAIDMAGECLAGGDLSAALTWYGRALGLSRDNEERAISKVHIAMVLHSLGKDWEAQMFIAEAREIDPQDVSGWSMPLADRFWAPLPQAAGA